MKIASIIIAAWLVLIFVFGVCVGSLVNVAAVRLPLQKSMIWPGSRCGRCLQPVRWYHNIPLVSYLWLRGRCASCGEPFSIRYFLVELATGLGWVGLFYLEVMRNIHEWPPNAWGNVPGFYPWQWLVGFFCHGVLFSFLMAASVCDLDGREIPLQLTLTGAAVGLIFAVLLPWPWPWELKDALPKNWLDPGGGLKAGLYPWPVWGPLPAWLAPGGNWQTGLATGLVGGLIGSLLGRGVRFLASAGLGKEGLGLGDADLMMMAGCFLGWQPVVVAFFVSPLPGLVVAMFQLIVRKDNSLPFGPSLAGGIIVTMLCWRWIGPFVQPLFFWGTLLAILCVVGAVLLLGLSFLFRLLRPATTES